MGLSGDEALRAGTAPLADPGGVRLGRCRARPRTRGRGLSPHVREPLRQPGARSSASPGRTGVAAATRSATSAAGRSPSPTTAATRSPSPSPTSATARLKRQLRRAPRRRRVRHQRAEGGVGLERHHRHGRDALLHRRSEPGLQGRRRLPRTARPARRVARQAARQARPAGAQPGRDLLRRRPHPGRLHGRRPGGLRDGGRSGAHPGQRGDGSNLRRPRAAPRSSTRSRTPRSASRAACRSSSIRASRRGCSRCSRRSRRRGRWPGA